MNNVFHISLCKRHDKDGLHLGGVEKFAYYLNRAIPDMEILCWSDHPDWIKYKDMPDFDKALALNEYLLGTGKLDSGSTVIVDGYWGRGLEGKVGRLVSVVHGSYYGRFLQSLIYPWGEVVPAIQMQMQIELWEHPQTEVVSVSLGTYKEVSQCAGVDSEIITHGVDLNVYRPMNFDRELVMHAATSARKGSDLINLLCNIEGFPFYVEAMNEYSGSFEKEAKRLNDAAILFAPTRHEGNSYLLLEALACGAPLYTYNTGFFCELSTDPRVGVVTDDLTVYGLKYGIQKYIDFYDDHEEECIELAREAAEEYADYNRFEKEWREYIGC